MTATYVISRDPHPAGDFVVRAYSMVGDHTSARELGRASTLEGARLFLPEDQTMTRLGRAETDDPRLLETWL